jgi:hypothetical protein
MDRVNLYPAILLFIRINVFAKKIGKVVIALHLSLVVGTVQLENVTKQ